VSETEEPAPQAESEPAATPRSPEPVPPCTPEPAPGQAASAESPASSAALPHASKLWVIPPILVAGLIAAQLASAKKGSPIAEPGERALPVRVVKLTPTAVIPRAVGHGIVRPRRSWSLVAKVSGTVAKLHELLQEGSLVPKDIALVEIEKTDYQLALNQTKALVKEVRAHLAELDANRASLVALLGIEKESLALAKRNAQRNRNLLATKSTTRAVVDQSERELLVQKVAVQRLRNSLAEVPRKRETILAQIWTLLAKEKQQQVNLQRTTMTAPFGLRIIDVQIERDQFVGAGQVLARGDGIEAVEIPAQFQFSQVQHLVKSLSFPDLTGTLDSRELIRSFKFSAIVRYQHGATFAEWKGRFTGTGGTADAQTRTTSFMVTVDRPYQQIVPGKRPPLVRGMFVEVELRGEPLEKCLVVPRAALRAGHVFVLDSNSRLRRVPVKIAFAQQDFVVIKSGLTAGDTIVVSDPIPSIDGMLLTPSTDAALSKRMLAHAAGEGSLR